MFIYSGDRTLRHPTIYPTGVTIYDSSKCFNGYTIFQANEHGAVLLDMNGGEVNFWKGLHGFPNKLLPGGYVMGSRGERNTDSVSYTHLRRKRFKSLRIIKRCSRRLR